MKPHLHICLVAFLLLAAAPAAAQPGRFPASVDTPLPPALRTIAEAVPHEQTPMPDEHYFRSNEWRHDLLVPHLRDLGGALVGVGADQNYTMCAMARCQMIFVVDFDPRIQYVHKIYLALVPPSDTPAALIAHFDHANAAATEALIRTRLAGDPDAERVVQHYRYYHRAMFDYLRRVAGLVRESRGTSWLHDPALYAYARALLTNGRLVARTGDVTGPTTMKAVAQATRQLGLTMRIVYLSNAEQFFPYRPGFVENMQAMPSDDRTVVVRTFRDRRAVTVDPARWHYVVHAMNDFLDRLASGRYHHSVNLSRQLVALGAPHLGPTGISVITRQTPLGQRRRASRP